MSNKEKSKLLNIKYVLILKYILGKMELALTKISKNGQIVIPSEIRKDARIKPATKFLVFNKKGTIVLKQLSKKDLLDEIRLVKEVFDYVQWPDTQQAEDYKFTYDVIHLFQKTLYLNIPLMIYHQENSSSIL